MRRRLWLKELAFLVLVSLAMSQTTERFVVAESLFYAGDKPDGWYLDSDAAEFLDVPGRFGHALSALGRGTKEWNFGAPTSFLGNKVHCYGGRLRFDFGHIKHSGAQVDGTSTWGVRLQSEPQGLVIGAFVREGLNDIELTEDNWILLQGRRRGHKPTHQEMLLTLTSLTRILIRGNYYSDTELTWVDNVQLMRGTYSADELLKRVRKHVKRSEKAKVGVGMVLGYTASAAYGWTVKKIVDGAPAQTSALIAVGDFVLSVDGTELGALSLQEVAAIVAGEEGSVLSVTMMRPSGVRYVETLTRGGVDPELAAEAVRRREVVEAGRREQDQRRREEERLRAEAQRKEREREQALEEAKQQETRAAEEERETRAAEEEQATRRSEETASEKLRAAERARLQAAQRAREEELGRRRRERAARHNAEQNAQAAGRHSEL